MPQRSAVEQLPDDVRTQLNSRLIDAGFANYEQLAEWLGEQGYQISKSAVHRYGQRFEQRLSALKVATEQARALTEAAPDDEGAMSDALIRLVQEKLFSILIDLDVESISKVNLSSLTKGISSLARATVKQKEWMLEMRAKAEEAATRAEKIARKGGLSKDAVEQIRREILGIAA